MNEAEPLDEVQIILLLGYVLEALPEPLSLTELNVEAYDAPAEA